MDACSAHEPDNTPFDYSLVLFVMLNRPYSLFYV